MKQDNFTRSVSGTSSLKNFLFNVELENIPLSEGINKVKYTPKGITQINIKSTKLLDINSKNPYLLIKSEKRNRCSIIKIISYSGAITKIRFKVCVKKHSLRKRYKNFTEQKKNNNGFW